MSQLDELETKLLVAQFENLTEMAEPQLQAFNAIQVSVQNFNAVSGSWSRVNQVKCDVFTFREVNAVMAKFVMENCNHSYSSLCLLSMSTSLACVFEKG